MGIRSLTEAKSGAGKYIIIGGAGFIGSHFTDRLLDGGVAEAVTVFDNFSSGREGHLKHHLSDSRFTVIKADVNDADALADAVAGGNTVIHLAANPDIARAAVEPAIDFDEGTVLTHNILEAMRQSGGGRILYASGSGVYGDLGEAKADEETGPMQPISTYGASKLASEAMIAAYCHLFGLTARVFRFGNVVGPRQTHGVGLDFIAKLRRDPGRLEILGDGRQSKPYIHVDDVIDAVLLADDKAETAFAVFNAAPGDAVTVTEIADMAVECLGLDRESVEYSYTGGERGWSGDVPVVRLNCDRLRNLGWTCRDTSRQAVRRSLRALAEQ